MHVLVLDLSLSAQQPQPTPSARTTWSSTSDIGQAAPRATGDWLAHLARAPCALLQMRPSHSAPMPAALSTPPPTASSLPDALPASFAVARRALGSRVGAPRAPATAAAAATARRSLRALLGAPGAVPPVAAGAAPQDPVARPWLSSRKRKRAVPWSVEGPARAAARTDGCARGAVL